MESFEGLRLRGILFVRKGIRSCKGRNLREHSVGLAFEGACGVVKFHAGQVGVDLFLQDNVFSTTAGFPTAQAHVSQITRLSVAAGEITYAYRVQLRISPSS